MRKPISDKIESIEPSGIRKFFDIASEMKDAISLGVGEPDFDTPWPVREEGIRTLQKGKTHYTGNSGLKELREEINNYLDRKYGLRYDPEHETLVTVGGSEAIDIAFRAMLNPGEEVIIPQPSYVSYLPCAILADGVPVVIPLQEKNEFKLTKEELLNAITPKTKILVLPFPNNPTGAVMTRSEIEEIAKVCIEKDIFVVSDEIYSELTYGGSHCSIASVEGMRERTIVINGFSKSHAMTGWRLGYACGPEVIMRQMLKIHQFAIMCAPTNSQYAAIEALRNGDEDVLLMKEEYDQRRRFMLTRLRGMGLQCFEPFGAFYIFPNIAKFGLSSDEFAIRFLKEEKVAVVPGTAFGASGEGFLRMSYASSLKNLKTAMERLEHFISTLQITEE
ncbi:MAG: pyridoxal phosphate-dependent aminotransferase [Butyrivibrio sp.]